MDQLVAGGKPIETFGWPSPCFADFRGTGKLDLICGEFRDGFTFFENIGEFAEIEAWLADVVTALTPWRGVLGTVATDTTLRLPGVRMCRPGAMQRPEMDRHHDGVDVLGELWGSA